MTRNTAVLALLFLTIALTIVLTIILAGCASDPAPTPVPAPNTLSFEYLQTCDCGANGYFEEAGGGASCPIHYACDCSCSIKIVGP